MSTCTYEFTTRTGDNVRLEGVASLKAWLLENGEESIGYEAPSRLVDVEQTVQQTGGSKVGDRPDKPGVLRAAYENRSLFRTAVIDRFARLDEVLHDAYQGIRSPAGRMNPMTAVRQAVDALKVAGAAMREGTWVFNKDGVAEVQDLTVPAGSTEFPLIAGEKVSVKGIMEFVRDLGKQEGRTYEQASKAISDILLGRREHNLHRRNADIDAQINALRTGPQANSPKTREAINMLQDQKQQVFTLTAAEAAARDARFQAEPDIQRVAQMMDAVRFSLIDRMVESGRISSELGQDWKDAEGYVTYTRLGNFTGSQLTRGGAARGVAAISGLLKLSGQSDRMIQNSVDSMAGLVNWMTKQALQNNAARRAVDDMLLLNMVRPGSKPAVDAPGGTFTVYRDGVPSEYYTPDTALSRAFLDTELSGKFATAVNLLQKFSQILRTGVTITPMFAFKQVAEDIQRAMLQSGVKEPLKLAPRILFNFPKFAVAELRGKMPPAMKELARMGVNASFDLDSYNYVKNLEIEAGVRKRTVWEAVQHYGEALAKASDAAARVAVYEQTMKETGDKALATERARELINFSRRGTSQSIETIARIVPFTNAYIQGMDRLWRAATGKSSGTGLSTAEARTMFRNRALLAAGGAMLYALSKAGDDEYESLEDYVKYGNWVLPGAKELGFTPAIPVPREIGFFAKIIPEATVGWFHKYGTEDQQNVMELAGMLLRKGRDDILFSPTPPAIKTFLETLTNYSFFMGRPLESQSQKEREAWTRYGNGTSQSVKDAAKAAYFLDKNINLSPIMIENTIRGVFGSAGGLVLGMTDAVLNPTRTDRPLHKMLGAQLTGAGAFMKDAVGTKNLTDLYDLNERASKAHNTLKRLQDNDPEVAGEFAERNVAELAVYESSKAALDAIRELRNSAQAIDKLDDADMPSDERLKAITELRRQQADIASVVRDLRNVMREIEAGQ